MTMLPIRDVYESPNYVSDYMPLIQSIDPEIEWVVVIDEDGYQGDSMLLGRKGQAFFYLTYGWGSCSGCDALQACESWDDLEELRSDLEATIKQFSSVAELQEWYQAKDWETEYVADELVAEFSQAVREYIAKAEGKEA